MRTAFWAFFRFSDLIRTISPLGEPDCPSLALSPSRWSSLWARGPSWRLIVPVSAETRPTFLFSSTATRCSWAVLFACSQSCCALAVPRSVFAARVAATWIPAAIAGAAPLACFGRYFSSCAVALVWLNVTSTSLAETAARMSSFWSSLADDFVQLSVERSWRFDQTVRELTRVMSVARTIRTHTSHALFLLMPRETRGGVGDAY